MNTIGKKIKVLRVQNGLSLKELGSLIGLSDTAILKIENGKTKNITIEIGKELAKAFNISFNELFEISIPTNEGKADLKEGIDVRKENEMLLFELESLRNQVNILRPILKLFIDKGMIGLPRTDCLKNMKGNDI
jgi:transcriptional regulator with XRE-family HTH domain